MNLHEILTDIHALENEIQQIRRKAPSLAGLVRVAV
jgi:hypothetical protein